MFIVEDQVSLRASEIPTLLTSRLRLRQWSATDVVELSQMYANPEVTRFFPDLNIEPITLSEIQRHWAKFGFGSWAVADRKTNRFLGTVWLANPGHWPTPEISWVLHPAAWNRGFATEAARAVIDHAFSVLEFSELMSVCMLGNKSSERVMQKLGMKRTSFLAAATHDPLLRTYLLTFEEWDTQHRRRTPVR